MKTLIVKYKSVIKFIATFLVVYILLSVTYKFYLQFSHGLKFYPDYFTHLVAIQSETLLNTFGYNTAILPHPNEPSIKLIVNGQYLARVIEGCNSISVIILFVSFVIAFSGQLKDTVLFVLSGGVLLYVVNLLRIVMLSIGIYHFPDKSGFLHTVIFPGIIYGMVFLLWMFWVNRFSKLNKKNE
ncbi:exosortase family protein XrtF [Postechiella marina]|uniref:exosortase family protein XrtF n=1 Tax=Postechiella marina TaxID=943941 RepID=UPI003CD0ABBF